MLPKGDPGNLQTLHAHIQNYAGFGFFVVCDKQGNELCRLRNIREICRLVARAGEQDDAARRLEEILDGYGEKFMSSTWLYMHSYPELADRLRPMRTRGKQLISLLEKELNSAIQNLHRTPLVLGDRQVYRLSELAGVLRSLLPGSLQPILDIDVISSWLDRKGYSELAEDIRPIHGRGPLTLAKTIADWLPFYNRDWQKSPFSIVHAAARFLGDQLHRLQK